MKKIDLWELSLRQWLREIRLEKFEKNVGRDPMEIQNQEN